MDASFVIDKAGYIIDLEGKMSDTPIFAELVKKQNRRVLARKMTSSMHKLFPKKARDGRIN